MLPLWSLWIIFLVYQVVDLRLGISTEILRVRDQMRLHARIWGPMRMEPVTGIVTRRVWELDHG